MERGPGRSARDHIHRDRCRDAVQAVGRESHHPSPGVQLRGDAQASQRRVHSGAPVAQKPNRPPTPFGMESLTYPVFAAVDRRLLALEARVLAEDRGCGFRKLV